MNVYLQMSSHEDIAFLDVDEHYPKFDGGVWKWKAMLFTWHLIGHMVSLDCDGDDSDWTHAILIGHGESCDVSHWTHGEEDADDKNP